MSQYRDAIDQILPRQDVGFDVMLMELCDILFVRETNENSKLELWLRICRQWGTVDQVVNNYTFEVGTYYSQLIEKEYEVRSQELLVYAFHLKHHEKMDFINAIQRIWWAIISLSDPAARVFAVKKILQSGFLPYEDNIDGYLPEELTLEIDQPKADYLNNFRRKLEHLIFIFDAIGAHTAIILLKALEDYSHDKTFQLFLTRVYHKLTCEFLEKKAILLAEEMVEAQQQHDETASPQVSQAQQGGKTEQVFVIKGRIPELPALRGSGDGKKTKPN